jgi:hypothetical protein
MAVQVHLDFLFQAVDVPAITQALVVIQAPAPFLPKVAVVAVVAVMQPTRSTLMEQRMQLRLAQAVVVQTMKAAQ